jgi:hypothetical protein
MSSYLSCCIVTIFGFMAWDRLTVQALRCGGVVGVSNVFAGSADLVAVWSDLIVVAAPNVSAAR